MALMSRVIDVSDLPASSRDTHDTFWWGNTLMLLIETTSVGLLIAAYFYVRQNFDQWPPSQVDRLPPIAHPLPNLLWGTLNTLLMLLSGVLMIRIDRAARRRMEALSQDPSLDKHARSRAGDYVVRGMLVLGLATLFMIVLRFFELAGVHFSWHENAYASTVWAILVLHLIYLGVGAAEMFFDSYWAYRYGLDETLALESTLVASYWYWTIGVWLLLYVVVYWFPRIAS
jgi:cytochrome c oxidase subunit III